MKLLLQLAASILLASVCASGWPYHEIVGVGQSATPVFVAPVYGVAPAVRLVTADPAKEVATVVAGPVTGTTIVEGSSSGPVTIVSPASVAETPVNAPPSTEKLIGVAADADSVLIKGASAGPVTLVAPSDSSVAVTDNAPSARAETKKGAAAASAEAGVAIENAEVSSAAEASANATVIGETIGVASARAVIGPSTGPVVIRGPTAPPPPTIAATTVAPATILTSTSNSVSVSSSAVVNATISNAVEEPRSGLAEDTTEAIVVQGSASSSASVTQDSESSVVSASAKVNLITPAARLPIAETPLSNIVVSAPTSLPAIVSGPSGSISTDVASALLLKAQL